MGHGMRVPVWKSKNEQMEYVSIFENEKYG